MRYARDVIIGVELSMKLATDIFMDNKNEYWVFGANGYLGKYIYRRMLMDNVDVIACSKSRSDIFNRWFQFDLRDKFIDYKYGGKNKRKIAIICAAKSGIDYCKVNYEESYRINVEGTIDLLKCLNKFGFYIIFLSSDNVFSGKLTCYKEEDMAEPINEYGKMKLMVEKYIEHNIEDSCIFRLSKVISSEYNKNNILSIYENKIKDGYIECLKNDTYNFISIEDIYNLIMYVSDRNITGLYHVVGDENISRAELAKRFYNKIGAQMNIAEVDNDKFGFADNRVLKLCLSNEKVKTETGYIFLNCDEMVEHYLRCER